MSTTPTNLLTAEEFAKLPEPPDGSKQELVRGEVITLPPPGFSHGKIQGRAYFALETYNRAQNVGQVTVESGIVTATDPDSVRGPDVALWSFQRLPVDRVPAVYTDVAPDPCVEVRSPTNSEEKMTEKVREYLRSGGRMVWVVDPEDRTVTVYRKPGDGRVLWDDATITGDDVLPGFSCPVAEFFR